VGNRIIPGVIICLMLCGLANAGDVRWIPPRTQAEVYGLLGLGALSNCALLSTRFSVDGCTHILPTPLGAVPIPTPCIRLIHNRPLGMVNASFAKWRQGTIATPIEGDWKYQLLYAAHVASVPTGFAGWVTDGMSGSASTLTYGQSSNNGVLVALIDQMINIFTVFSACYPLHTFANTAYPGQYLFVSEADVYGDTPVSQQVGTWAGTYNNYMFFPHTSMLGTVSPMMERTGMCAADVANFFCYGSFGTVYPSWGRSNTDSMPQALAVAARSSTNIALAPTLIYGPMHNAIGGFYLLPLHSYTAWYPAVPQFWPATTGRSYTQQIYPFPSPFCVPDTRSGIAFGEVSQVASKTTMEVGTKVFLDESTLTFYLWPRYTCCNMCSGIPAGQPHGGDLFAPALIGPTELPARFFSVGLGFQTQLIPGVF
jgi:hypothetical protein